jgi:hypothetical protein
VREEHATPAGKTQAFHYSRFQRLALKLSDAVDTP